MNFERKKQKLLAGKWQTFGVEIEGKGAKLF
jgi:hypothetical protein